MIANTQTQLDVVSNLPKNQTGLSYAIGMDFQLAKNTGLYVRQRWFKYNDANYSLDKYAGTETTVELKIFF
jgi:predicted porin